MGGPFTREVTKSLDYLRQAIQEVPDTDLLETLTAIVDDLLVNLEDQMMLVFANCNIKEKEREDMFLKRNTEESLLEYYQESVAALKPGALPATLKRNAGKPAVVQEEPRPAEVETARTVGTALYLTLEALAYELQAERATLYIAHKGTGSLRVVTSVPDISPAQNNATIAMHQGIPGATYNSEIMIRVDRIDDEMRKNYVAQTDKSLGVTTNNALAAPVVDRMKRTIVGVVECLNKVGGSSWTEHDEAILANATHLLSYMMTRYSAVDLFSGFVFNPSGLHLIAPYKPAAQSTELQLIPLAMGHRKPMLIARVVPGQGLPMKMSLQHQDNANEVRSLLNVREVSSYLRSMDRGYLQSLSEVVDAKEREDAAKEVIQSQQHRIKVLEENAVFLHEQVQEAKRSLARRSLASAAFDANYEEFGSTTIERTGMAEPSRRGSEAPGRFCGQLPPLPGPKTDVPGEGPKLHDFLVSANVALEKLRKSALDNATGLQRARLFATPQPRNPGRTFVVKKHATDR